MTDRPDTFVDRILTRAKNNPVLGTIIVIGIVVIAIGKFVGAAQPFIDFFSIHGIFDRQSPSRTSDPTPGNSITANPTPGNSITSSVSSTPQNVSPAIVKVFNEDFFAPSGVTFSSKGHLFAYVSAAVTAIGTTGVVKIYDVNSWKLTKQLFDEESRDVLSPWFFALAFSPDGHWLAAATSVKGIIIYNTDDWSIHKRLKGHKFINSIAFSPDGKKLVSAEDKFVPERNAVTSTTTLWDLDAASDRRIDDLASSVGSITFSHDGKRIAAGTADGTITIWDVLGHSPPLIISASGGSGLITFNRDDSWLASGTAADGIIRLWSTASGKLLRTLTWSPTPASEVKKGYALVNAIALSPDGRQLASRQNETVALWDAMTDSHIENYQYQAVQERPQNIDYLSFSPDGNLLAESSGRTKLVIVWRVNKPER
jgi:WD40 repeat protein